MDGIGQHKRCDLAYLVLVFVVVAVVRVLVVGVQDRDVIASLERCRLKTHIHLLKIDLLPVEEIL